MNKDYYSILEIDKDNFSEDVLKKNYRKLSKKWHPDRMSGKSDAEKKEAEEKMKEINEAYDVLSNPDKKAQYDNPFGSGSGNYSDVNWNSQGGWAGDPFEEMKRQHEQAAKRGQDINMRIPISIDEIIHGCEKKVKYRRNIRCSTCDGLGGTGKMTCPYCHGEGKITKTVKQGPYSIFQSVTTCPHCGGKGYKIAHVCPDCNGTGFQQKEEILKIHFGPGIVQGEGIQYTSMGHESKYKDGGNGNFYAIPVYNFNPEEYSVEYPHIIHKVKVNMVDALIGGKMAVELAGLGKVEVDVPPCSKPGANIVLSGKGAPMQRNPFDMNGRYTSNGNGDYILVIEYTMPDKLTSKQKDLLKEFKKTLK